MIEKPDSKWLPLATASVLGQAPGPQLSRGGSGKHLVIFIHGSCIPVIRDASVRYRMIYSKMPVP